MSLLFLSADILKYIMEYTDDVSNSKLTQTCSFIHTHSDTFGYVNVIHADMQTSMRTFIKRFCKHANTIKTVIINRVDDPHLWIPNYVENLKFEHCSITEYFNPGKQGKIVKSLKLTDYNRYRFKNKLKINWKCFPNLEILELYVYDVNTNGIKKFCKKLTKFNTKIDTLAD